MRECLTFDDVLIEPRFSNIKSRKEVDLSVHLKEDYTRSIYEMTLPVMSANMDTITGKEMAQTMHQFGGLGVLHRFLSVQDNVDLYRKVTEHGRQCAVSVGLGDIEKNRATALYDECDARIFVLDVAHGAQSQTVEMYKWLKENLKDIFVIVGNFATAESCKDFWAELNQSGIPYYHKKNGSLNTYGVDAFKIGIGPGSACTTRIKTGIGVPQLSAILDVCDAFRSYLHRPLIIADGGMKTPGDIAKALAAGADCVMLGGMLAGTDETPGDSFTEGIYKYKKYRGSASKESYNDQGKDSSWRTAEGESFAVLNKGPAAQVLQDIEGGLRSAFTYVGARNLQEFHERAKFVRVTSNGVKENGAHGKSNNV